MVKLKSNVNIVVDGRHVLIGEKFEADEKTAAYLIESGYMEKDEPVAINTEKITAAVDQGPRDAVPQDAAPQEQ